METRRTRGSSSVDTETTSSSDTNDGPSETVPEVDYQYQGRRQRSHFLCQTMASKQGDAFDDGDPRVVAAATDAPTSSASTSRAQATRRSFPCADTASTSCVTTAFSSATFDTPSHLRGLGERCTVCNEAMDNWQEFVSHMHSHDPVPSDPGYFEDCDLPNGYFQCIICGYQAATRHKLKTHYVKHASDYPFNCPLCSSKFKSCKSFFHHYGRVHGGGRHRYKCDQCDYASSYKQNLQRHILKHSGHDGKERCEVCFKRFESSGLRRHYFTHTGEKPHACHVCGKGYVRKTRVKRHITHAHLGRRQRTKCPVCGKSMTPRVLLEHVRRHTDEPTNICCICGKQFYRPVRYALHMDRVHVGTKKFPCPVCGKRFFALAEVQQHVPVHTKEKPYKCEVCGKAFSWKHKIKDHTKTHSEDRPFKCYLCGEAFKWKHNLSNHVRAKHV